MISYGVTSESKNCFCSHRPLFGCTSTCNKAENTTIASWLAAACQVTAKVANNAVADDQLVDSEAKAGGPSPPHRAAPLRWYEKLGISVFGTTIGVLLVAAFVKEWLEYRSAKGEA